MTGEFIFERGPFPSCHASTIAEVNGSLVAAWFGGTDEGEPDVGIWVSRKSHGQWSAPTEVATGSSSDGKPLPCWNPVLFQPPEGPLLLFYKVGPSPSTWWGMLIRSSDAGKTWTEPVKLPAGMLGPIKNKPVQLAGGDILCGSSDETRGWRVHFERTSDLGKTWRSTGPIHDGVKIAAIQPSILFHPDGRLQAIGRTRQKRMFSTFTSDSGNTWTPMELLDVANPNSGTDAVTLRCGRHLLVYNNTATGRSPLNVADSIDGLQWSSLLTLEDEPGEYSYPAVIQASDGTVHITYTWHRKRIKHVSLDPQT